MGAHIINGEFQSDKYPTTPRGKVPLSVKDPTAQDLLWQYAQRRRAVDGEFADDLEASLIAAGYVPSAAWTPTPAFTALREAWLDIPWEGQVEKGDGHWIQTLINAATAIVDPDGKLRKDPDALRRGQIATHRRRYERAIDQLALAEKHGIADAIAQNIAARDDAKATLRDEFGIDLDARAHQWRAPREDEAREESGICDRCGLYASEASTPCAPEAR